MNQGVKTNFKPLYRVAQYLSLSMIIIVILQIAIFAIAPPPDTVEEFFILLNRNPFLGLLSLDFLYLFNNAIIVIIYLTLFVILYREKPVTVLLALVLGLIGVACYYPSNPAFEMLTLSRHFFLALPEQQSIYLAAGESLMAGYSGTSFNVYYVLSTICLLLFAYAIIKSPKFKKPVGWVGLVSGLLMVIPSSAGVVGMIFSLLSLIPWVAFVAMLVCYFRKFASDTSSVNDDKK